MTDNIFDELVLLVRSRFTLIQIISYEEEVIQKLLTEVARATNRRLICWNMPNGKFGSKPLEELKKITGDNIFYLPDFHEYWSDKQVKRELKILSYSLAYTKSTIVVSSPSHLLPEELRDRVVTVELPLPGEAQLSESLQTILDHPDCKTQLDEDTRRSFVQAALGLTNAQASRVFVKAIVKAGASSMSPIDTIDLITEEKKDLIRQSEALKFIDTKINIESVGGLQALKSWLRLRSKSLTPAAREYGLDNPKGVALIGIPGTGKSLAAKMISSLWNLNLLQLEVGSLFGSYVGESEARTRLALKIAEAIAPCVLWIDELEKAISTGSNDSGTSTRVLGTLLTWMAEKTAPVFVVATANDISRLPPELLRRGRFDEIFFLDLPNEEERHKIFEVHLAKRKRSPACYNLDALVTATKNFVGAEIENCVIDAMYLAFAEDREFTTEDILTAASRTVPMAVSQAERISYLRSWLTEGRAISAS